ncbi:hypothetical protein OH802_06450 [Nocardioides sp. NBC_00850]|uniref:hypothetical protein n=1 Tax=Nocardioides sp. NBC_00850 TaxID=2976001 RepID=UPI00386F5133|nr:hypothetical protein OH802_06450 [Nocardioides sp. NBC_00850]
MRVDIDSSLEGDWRTVRVRILASSWGLVADLTARLRTDVIGDGRAEATVQIRQWRLALDVSGCETVLVPSDIDALVRGFELMAAAVPVAGGPQILVIEVQKLWYPLTDYQPEAAMIAMAHWIAAHLDLDDPEFDIEFDRADNRYLVIPQNGAT